MNKTPIEWTDYTINPIRFRNLATGRVGHHCVKISPGCANCYSSTMQAGPYLSGLTFIAENTSKGVFFLDEGALQQVLKRRMPCKIFWCDMTDMFGDWVPDEWIDRCFAVMALTPHLTHQILTKRPERMAKYFKDASARRAGWWEALHDQRIFPGDPRRAVLGSPSREGVSEGIIKGWRSLELPNVWLGTSVENQEYANLRVPLLQLTPSATRFISYEPALGGIDWFTEPWTIIQGNIHLLICGGESGPGARPFHLEWMRSTVEQCQVARVAVFCKQIGSNPYWAGYPLGKAPRHDKKGGDMESWPEDLRIRQFPEVRV